MNAMTQIRPRPLRVAIAGYGAVGRRVAQALDDGLPGYELTAIAARDKPAAARSVATLRYPVPVVDIAELEGLADLVVEAAPAALLADIASPFLAAGKRAVVLSAGALLEQEALVELARQHGGQIIVPSGALLGLDAVAAAAQGEIHSVRLVTRKPVKGLLGAPYLEQNSIDLAGVVEATRIFQGSARQAAIGFPANVNVAAALSLAGIGPDQTRVEIWADPALTRNTHSITVEADSARFSMSIEGVPSENPKTGRITALSVIACLRKLAAPLRVGT
ncbi:aspartate dehydrogenase [Pseudoroseomonas cervicalis]|uniref:aspartate dehydrogenase n=1 Tax=Teichococcus cervicalis TaxID=204525 RepID=UPI0022F15CED|nr:aspartate dehydrogenase [Pseudoroseomonas cervicalis]WBV44423.1 aspartate dehydrogenase [Pseudoroseomonas cervicalis]